MLNLTQMKKKEYEEDGIFRCNYYPEDFDMDKIDISKPSIELSIIRPSKRAVFPMSDSDKYVVRTLLILEEYCFRADSHVSSCDISFGKDNSILGSFSKGVGENEWYNFNIKSIDKDIMIYILFNDTKYVWLKELLFMELYSKGMM